MYHEEAGELSEVRRTQLAQVHTLCNPCTRLHSSQACIQTLLRSWKKSGLRLVWLLRPFLGILLLWHVILGFTKATSPVFTEGLFFLSFLLDFPLPLFFASGGLGFDVWASAARTLAWSTPSWGQAWVYLTDRLVDGKAECDLEDYVPQSSEPQGKRLPFVRGCAY